MTNLYHQEGNRRVIHSSSERETKPKGILDYVSGMLPQRANSGLVIVDYGVPSRQSTGIFSPKEGYSLVFHHAPSALLNSLDQRGNPNIDRFLEILEARGYTMNKLSASSTYRVNISVAGGKVNASFPGRLPRETRELIDKIRQVSKYDFQRA